MTIESSLLSGSFLIKFSSLSAPTLVRTEWEETLIRNDNYILVNVSLWDVIRETVGKLQFRSSPNKSSMSFCKSQYAKVHHVLVAL